MMSTGLIVGGIVRLVKYGFDTWNNRATAKEECQQQENERAHELQKMRVLKEIDLSIEEYKSLTATAEANKQQSETEKAWIDAAVKTQLYEFKYLSYFTIGTEQGIWYNFVNIAKGFANFIVLLSNCGITAMNVLNLSQKLFVTLLIGYAVIHLGGTSTGDRLADAFDAIIAYHFLDKDLFVKLRKK